VRPSVDAIREFEMLTSTYDASFGRNPGAQVNVILNSGGNDFHGSLFEFHRNAALDARNFFAPASSRSQNTFATSLAAPLVVQSSAIAPSSLPTTKAHARAKASRASPMFRPRQERAGNFSQSLFGVPIESIHGHAVSTAA
jgi:hypothetical protein